MFSLAIKLGKTPRELLAVTTSAELTELAAFLNLKPEEQPKLTLDQEIAMMKAELGG